MPRGGANFSSEELARVLSYYNIGIIQQLKPLTAVRKTHNGGSRRAAKVVIVSEGGKFLLKRRAKGKDDPQRVAFAHSIQTKLAQMDFPVAALVAGRDGETIIHLDNHIYELFKFMDGSRYDGKASATIDAGRQLAKFHTHLSDFASQYKPAHSSFHDSRLVRKHLKSLGARQPAKHKASASGSRRKPGGSATQLRAVSEALTQTYEAASRRANEMGFDTWSRQIIHGDWHPGNMLFSAGRIIAVLDFDSVKIAAPVTDLANAMLQFSIVAGRPNPADWPDYLDQAKLTQVLSGYQQVCVLDDARLGGLPELMIETMIAEAVLPIAATGFFGNLSGLDFLKMIRRKCDWINNQRDTLTKAIRVRKL